MKKRIVSTFMCLAMLLSLLCVNAFAAVSTALTVTVGTDGTISVQSNDEVYTGTALSYYIVEEDKTSVISAWTAETTASDVAADLGATAEAGKPTITADNNGKYVVVVDIAEEKVAAAGQSAAINITAGEDPDQSITALTVAVDNAGTISVKSEDKDYTATGTLTYFIVDATKAAEIAAWTTDTASSKVQTDLGVAGTTTAPTLTADNNGKFLVVVDIAGDKVAAAGQSAAINIDAGEEPEPSITALTVAVDNAGTISVKSEDKDYTATGTLTYFIVDATKAAEIAAWTTDTASSKVQTDLGVAGTTTAPTLTADNNGKFLVVVDIAGDKVAAAGQSAAINVSDAETPGESVDIPGSTSEGTYTGSISTVTPGDIAKAEDGLVTFAPAAGGDDDAQNIDITLSADAVNALVTGSVGASIQTQAGGIELPAAVLESITDGAASKAVVLNLDKVDPTSAGEAFHKAGNTDAKLTVYDVTVKVDSKEVTDLGGNVKLTMAADADAAYLIYAKPATGGGFTYERVNGAVFRDGFVTWTSNHLSTYGTTDKAGARAFITVALGSTVEASGSIGPKVTIQDITGGNYVTVQVVSGGKVVSLWSVNVAATSYDFYVPTGAIVTVWETAEALAFGDNGVITNTPVGTLDLTAAVGE